MGQRVLSIALLHQSSVVVPCARLDKVVHRLITSAW